VGAAEFSPLSITGATSGSLTFRIYGSGGTGTGSSGNWRVDDISLTIVARVPPPVIWSQPAATTVNSGQSANLTVVASGTGALTYQWRFNGAALAGATSATLSLGPVTTAAAGNYARRGWRFVCQPRQLRHRRAHRQPDAHGHCVFQSGLDLRRLAASRHCRLEPCRATIALTYQGTGGADHPASPSQPTAIGMYLVTATITDAEHQGSATGKPDHLRPERLVCAAVVANGPASQTVLVGDPFTLMVNASGKPVPTLQWRKGGVPIAGATGAAFSVGAAALADAGGYDVVLTNAMGTTTSASASLTVERRPDNHLRGPGQRVCGWHRGRTRRGLQLGVAGGVHDIVRQRLAGRSDAQPASAKASSCAQSSLATRRPIWPHAPVDRTVAFVVGLAAPVLRANRSTRQRAPAPP
jgi:hypothetical protein